MERGKDLGRNKQIKVQLNKSNFPFNVGTGTRGWRPYYDLIPIECVRI